MDFEEFEQLVLRLLFETEFPVTAAHAAYVGRISTRLADRHLARMVEQGTLFVRTTDAGDGIEYYHPGRRLLVPARDVSLSGPPPIFIGESFLVSRPKTNPFTAVLLSMLIPGAGHIYAGRPGPGVAWMATTLMGYACCFLPGLFIHGLCLLSAARVDRGTA
jgi:hypothetical protein